jgi:outer membrane receptor protein involved in Fe transport
LRIVQQSLDEISKGTTGFFIDFTANSPLPRSQSVNPGLFAELQHAVDEQLSFTAGTRVDYVDAQVNDNPAKLAALGIEGASLAAILGTSKFDQNFVPWAAFLTGQYQLDDELKMTFGAGHSERPPNLTELYVAESYLFLLQNGENTATGDPLLKKERLTQLDIGLQLNQDRLRSGANGFFGWAQDYITFENMQVVLDPSTNKTKQVDLKYVNTDLATLAGFESYLELDAASWATMFANAHYVQGQDRTRNGHFATKIHSGMTESKRVAGRTRGNAGGPIASGPSSEPLPGILPLECRLGVRLRPPSQGVRWSAELSARIVDRQNRVAKSLLETPTAGFTLWDLRGTWQATNACFFVAGVENFTNKNFREHLDFRSASGFRVLQPGINFYVGSEVKY